MRWVFPETETEKQQRNSTVALIDAWWAGFTAKAPQIVDSFSAGGVDWDLAGWMQDTLQAVHPELMWEYGPAVRTEGHRLVITPEHAHKLRPLTDTIIERAPAMPGWEFHGHRLAEPYPVALDTVQGRCATDITDWRVMPSIAGRKVDLTFFSPQCSERHDPDSLSTAFVAVETLLGEDRLNKWIGAIDVMPSRSRRRLMRLGKKKATVPAGALAVSDLHDHVAALIAGLLDELPTRPRFEDDSEQKGWIFELSPAEQDDYPEVADMFVGKATIPDFFQAVRSGYFDSQCFSRCGETFCYVKLDGSAGLDAETFADKGEIEDALDARLRQAGHGCFAGGGGTGLRYSYVDLALTNLELGIDLVRNVLREGNVPNRTWIMFYDTNMSAEWVGVYPDTPPPPS